VVLWFAFIPYVVLVDEVKWVIGMYRQSVPSMSKTMPMSFILSDSGHALADEESGAKSCLCRKCFVAPFVIAIGTKARFVAQRNEWHRPIRNIRQN